MKEETLRSLYCYFIKARDSYCDDVDGVYAKSGDFVSEESSNKFPQHFTPPHLNLCGAIHAEGLSVSTGIPVYQPEAAEVVVSNGLANLGANLLQLADEFSSLHPENCPIKFETSCMVVSPQGQVIPISIVRSDQCVDKVTKVAWKTCDKSAFSGKHFVGSSGEIKFDTGESKKKIEIQLLEFEDEASDLRFTVKLSDLCGVYNPAPITVTLKKTDHYYDDERDVINNLSSLSQSFSVYDLASVLRDRLNKRTFYIGLSHLCSKTDTLNVQLALALQLAHLCRSKLREDVILNVLNDFFATDDIDA